jgi:hypothetical protein
MTNSPGEVQPGEAGLSTAQPPYAPAAEPEPILPQPVPPKTETAGEEVDVWWGSYTGWTMAPSWAACVLVTGLIAWAAWMLLPRTLVQPTVLGLGGAVWLFQGVRWAYRVFGYNYRLTSRRVYVDRGFLYTGYASGELTGVAGVYVKRSWLDRLLRVGQIRIELVDKTKPPLFLDGVRRPAEIAERIRERVKAAQASGCP